MKKFSDDYIALFGKMSTDLMNACTRLENESVIFYCSKTIQYESEDFEKDEQKVKDQD